MGKARILALSKSDERAVKVMRHLTGAASEQDHGTVSGPLTRACQLCGKRVATLLVQGKPMCKPCYDNRECDDLEDELHDIDGTL